MAVSVSGASWAAPGAVSDLALTHRSVDKGRSVALADWSALGKGGPVRDGAQYSVPGRAGQDGKDGKTALRFDLRGSGAAGTKKSAGATSPGIARTGDLRWTTARSPFPSGGTALVLPSGRGADSYRARITLPAAQPVRFTTSLTPGAELQVEGLAADGRKVVAPLPSFRAAPTRLSAARAGGLQLAAPAGQGALWDRATSADVAFAHPVKELRVRVAGPQGARAAFVGPFGSLKRKPQPQTKPQTQTQKTKTKKGDAGRTADRKRAAAAPADGEPAPKTHVQVGELPSGGTVQFPIDEPFTGTTTQHTWAVFKRPTNDADTAKLGGGWLQLTAPKNDTAGAYVMEDSFTTDKGVLVDFDYNVSDPKAGGGADGFALMLIDGSVTPTRTGTAGGALGYACATTQNSGPCQAGTPGIEGGWLGVGFDTFGGWSSVQVGNGGPGATPNAVGLRGSGTGGTTGYNWIAGPKPVSGGMTTGDGNSSRHARVLVQGTMVTVWIENPANGELVEVVPRTDVSTVAGQAPLPPTFKLGFVGGTGGSYEAHKVKNLAVTLPVKAQIEKTGTATAGAGDTVSYTVTATQLADSPNPITGAVIKDTVPPEITNVSWTCTATNGGSCGTPSGTGNTINTTADLPVNSKATVTVTGKASKSAHPAKNTATLTLPPANANLDENLPLSASQDTDITADDFDVTPSAAGGPVAPGASTTIPVKVRNNGADDAQADPVVTVKLPTGVTPSGTQPTGCTASGDTVTCTVPKASLTKGSTVDLPISVTVAASSAGSTTLTQAGGITVNGTLDTDSTNNTADASVQVSARSADLKLDKTVDPPDPDFGGDAKYTIKVTNDGPSDTTNVKVTDKLPAGATWKSDDSSGAYNPTTGVWTVGALTSGASKSLVVTVTMDSTSAITNAVTEATSDATDPTPCNASNPTNCASVTSTATGADLAVTKTVDNATPDYGSNVTFTLTVNNGGPKAATGVTVTDKLPSGLTYVSDNGAGSYDSSSGVWTVGNLANGANKSLTITAKVDTTTNVVNSITEADGTPGDPTPCNAANPSNCASASVTPVAADLSTDKDATTTTPVKPGDTYDYEITVSNAGPSAATNVKATDTLPSELAFVSSPDGCTASGQDVTCPEVSTVAKGASTSWTIKVRLSADYTGDGTDIHNQATGAADQPDPDPSNNTSSATGGGPPGGTVDPPEADVSVAKQASANQPVHPGEEFDYTVTVTNQGPSSAAQIELTDTLPSQVTFVSSADGCTASGQTVTCPALASLSPQAGSNTKTYTYTVRLDSSYTGDGTDVKNQATATAQTNDPDTSNNTASTDLSGLPGGGPEAPSADLELSKDTTQSTRPVPGTTFPYTLEVTNNGPSDARDVVVTDRLPSELSFVSGDDCSASGRTVTCGPEGTVDSGKSKHYTITVKLASSAEGDGSGIVNTAEVSSSTADPDMANNRASKGLPGGGMDAPSADVEITKATATDTAVEPGETFAYKLTVNNDGPSDAVDVTATDRLPEQVSFVSSTDGCTATGRTVNCPVQDTLKDRATKTFVFTVELEPDYSGDGSDITNTARVTSDTADPKTDNNAATLDNAVPGGHVVTPEADLETNKKAVDSEGVGPGGTFGFAITVTNHGPSPARHVTVTDPLPKGLTFTASTDGCKASGQTVTCPAVASLNRGDSVTFSFTVRLDKNYRGDGSDLANVATVDSSTHDPNTANDQNSGSEGTPQGLRLPKDKPHLPDTGSDNSVELLLAAMAASLLLAGGVLITVARRRQ
ncbi:LPXTG cell wall anchor domain-containing protein [Streptomyces sp. NPDC050658]|uniref:LPXTG cell wall anchor domain-containing protein n=1 Tax=unclassified Streptomyces TaxID=2593676 RepID=UPI00341685B6